VTPQQATDLLASLLEWRAAQGALADGASIEAVTPVGPGRLVLTTADTRTVISVKTYRRQP